VRAIGDLEPLEPLQVEMLGVSQLTNFFSWTQKDRSLTSRRDFSRCGARIDIVAMSNERHCRAGPEVSARS